MAPPMLVGLPPRLRWPAHRARRATLRCSPPDRNVRWRTAEQNAPGPRTPRFAPAPVRSPPRRGPPGNRDGRRAHSARPASSCRSRAPYPGLPVDAALITAFVLVVLALLGFGLRRLSPRAVASNRAQGGGRTAATAPRLSPGSAPPAPAPHLSSCPERVAVLPEDRHNSGCRSDAWVAALAGYRSRGRSF